jgi:DNA-binding XRE family transcriptional regulator
MNPPPVSVPNTNAKVRAAKAPNPAASARALGSSAISQDIAEMRSAAGMSQASLSDVFGWERFAISKLETGRNDVYLFDYLKMADFLRDVLPDHPAVALHDFIFKKPARRR